MNPIRCRCGAVQGTVADGSINNRVRCYCKDCQAFARFLGRASEILDHSGGTDIVQVAQVRVRFSSGLERLAAVRLTEAGMLRWYASCCNTPIGNTMRDPKWAFVGLIHSCLAGEQVAGAFGSKVARVNTSSAIGDLKPEGGGLPGFMFRLLGIVVSARLFRERHASPFFDSSGATVVTPRVLSAAELEQFNSAA